MDTSQRVRAIMSFVGAADAGSFAAAARALGISPAAVSQNVAGLETALGVRLMNRTTRSLNLTEEGSAFLRQARIALDALDQATDAVVAARATPTGKIRISTSAAFGREQLLPLLPGLLTQYPALTTEVDFDDRIVDLVQEGYDLALRGGRIADSSLVSRRVCRMNLILVATPAYLEQYGVPRRPHDLERHQLITRKFLGGRVSPWNFVGSDGSMTTLNTEHALLTLSSPESLVQAALADLGVAEVGVHHAWRHLQQGELKILLPRTHHPGSYEMSLQYPHRALVAPRVRVAVEYLLERFAAMEELHVPLASLRRYAA